MLEGKCYTTSRRVNKLFQWFGIASKLVAGDYYVEDKEYGRIPYAHWWVEVGDTVIDLTVCQFKPLSNVSVPFLYIGKRNTNYDVDVKETK